MLFEFTNPLNESPWSFPILECIHITGFALSIGTIAMVDFRLLGVGMLRQTAAQLLKDTAIWTLVGIVIMVFSGLLLFSSDPDMYYLNWAFLIKMVCLLLAIVFNYTVHRKVARSETPPANGKLVAGISLGLWSAVVFCGIFIAFINPGLSLAGSHR